MDYKTNSRPENAVFGNTIRITKVFHSEQWALRRSREHARQIIHVERRTAEPEEKFNILSYGREV